MYRSQCRLLLIMVCLALYAAEARAQVDLDKLQDRIDSVLFKADELESKERHDEARELRELAERLIVKLQEWKRPRPETPSRRFQQETTNRLRSIRARQNEIRTLLREATELDLLGHHDEAHKLRQAATQLSRHQPRQEDDPAEMERIEHFRQAAEHLLAAGLEAESHELLRRAEQMERELRERHERRETPKIPQRLLDQLAEMKTQIKLLSVEVETLRDEVHDLQKLVGSRPVRRPDGADLPQFEEENSVPQ